ncbi:group II intron reverse transcriptase-maturase [Halomicronema hongdechloris C2206]|uniref:Group II intron reverse transcriptase-maturase n=1 Tax=Halomicronema hongdechloris C2206 TaxID=1641165 RepID=A0A1Z3HI06_9CYAN|nr:group II intron reverse transcriptase/maturase [Halomicronema hongdechloris]ASC69926.1 group II intron reverse transcriptase-maturase [Halomicronema hongdechloris C2206]
MTDSDVSMNLDRGDTVWRTVMQPALDINLMAKVVAKANLQKAWQRVKSNQGAPGSDGMSLEAFPGYAREHWPTIRQSLWNGTYHPQPVRRVVIPKPGGRGERLLGVPCVVDRVIQQAILQVLTPIFDPGFSESSFGSRPQRSAHGAIAQIKGYLKEGYRVAVDLDLEKFFDTVHHDVLMSRVSRKVHDKVLLKLIGRYLRAGVMVDGIIQATAWGTPQGSPLSPLLANILLAELDQELEQRGHRFVRYMDDLVILVRSERAGKRVMASVSRYLTQKLKLKVNRQKSQVVNVHDLEYLGFQFRGIRVYWSDQAFADFKHRLKGLTARSWRVSMAHRLERLNQYLRGWMGYFGISQYYHSIPDLDGWLRRRLRMCYWKQWRRPRTRIQKLLELGTDKRHAIRTGISRKGYWHLSRTLATQTGMTNEWLAKQGLLSIRDLWMKAQGYI